MCYWRGRGDCRGWTCDAGQGERWQRSGGRAVGGMACALARGPGAARGASRLSCAVGYSGRSRPGDDSEHCRGGVKSLTSVLADDGAGWLRRRPAGHARRGLFARSWASVRRGPGASFAYARRGAMGGGVASSPALGSSDGRRGHRPRICSACGGRGALSLRLHALGCRGRMKAGGPRCARRGAVSSRPALGFGAGGGGCSRGQGR